MHIPRVPSEQVAPTEQTGGGYAWSLNRFMQLNPPLFSGTTDPMEANRWIVDARKILTASECLESRLMTFATFLLLREAEEWWRELSGNMIVAQYEDKLNALSRFCPRVISDDAARANHFKMGLRIKIHKQVNMVKNLTYAELVENVGIAERDLLEERS
ncbi:uncharacterized protein [Typha latifolia]|uniref:uncharacterized protein n=1 Tax=Typha latifolia TaxID=4733 RepID=UPI003C2C268E